MSNVLKLQRQEKDLFRKGQDKLYNFRLVFATAGVMMA
jgi:hypothetical protein